jgi:hypothetical protein
MSGDTASGEAATPEERRALFRVVRGTPSDAELAALTVVLAAAALSPEPAAPTRPASVWASPAARMRRPLQPGSDAWRASTWAR